MDVPTRRDRLLVGVIAALISVNAFLYFLSRGQTYVHIDAIAHVNKARGLFDNFEPGLRNLGSVWLPLPHLLTAPLAISDALWRSGAAGSLLSVACFIGTGIFLFLTGSVFTGSRIAGWVAFMLFVLNPRLIYFFTTPENETLMIFCAAGLIYYLIRWTQKEQWRDFGAGALFAFAGTLTRYEGWALATAACLTILITTRSRRVSAAIVFAGASVLGPLLWMIYNMVYFDDPLMFAYGIGSALTNDTGKRFGTAGRLLESALRYFIDVAYAVNPGVLWLAAGGVFMTILLLRSNAWRPAFGLLSIAAAMFGFYVLNLYSGNISILLPGVVPDDPQSMYNVRYGTVMAPVVSSLAGLFVFVVWLQVHRKRAAALLMLLPLILPDPIPGSVRESVHQQFASNLFYTEAMHNQSFWLPPFIEAADKVDGDGLILTNTRIMHVIVWETGTPMKRFITEMNEDAWARNFTSIDPRVRWVITEEGDQLWHGPGRWLEKNWVEVASTRGEVTGTVHVYRRPE